MIERIEDNIKGSVDWVVILLYFVLVTCGWISIYGASYDYESSQSMYDLSTRAGMQLVWMGISAVLAFILLKLDSNVYDVSAYLIYSFFIFLLLLTVFIAPDIKGSRSWIVITNSIRFQPAEFAKFAVALALARFLNSYNFKLMTVKNILIVACLIIIPMLLIFAQKEAGSALVYLAFILAIYREGLPGVILLFGLCAIVLFVIGLKYSEVSMGMLSLGEVISVIIVIFVSIGLIANFKKDYKIVRYIIATIAIISGGLYLASKYYDIDWGVVVLCILATFILFLLVLAIVKLSKTYLYIALFSIIASGYIASESYVFSDILQPHQQMRIKVSLGMEDDLMGAGYNVNQSKIAIGSGGLTGKGFLNGTQTKLKYVPEQDTDFIFCTVGEEHGFVGSVAILLLFTVFILRLIYLSERQKSTFGRVYGYCVASVFLFHLTINVGMVIGILPVIGIPLPFFSYGGSSLLGFTILLFIFLRIDMYRKRR